MRKPLALEETYRYLVDDPRVRDAIVRKFRNKALMILTSLVKGAGPELYGADVGAFLHDLLKKHGRLYKRYTAHDSSRTYHIDVCGLGGVYFYGPPDFDTMGYFLSIDDALDSIKLDWDDYLISDKGRAYRKPFVRNAEATQNALSELKAKASNPSLGLKIPTDWHHLIHGELTDVPGRNESWGHYLCYLGKGRWKLITQSTDFYGMDEIQESQVVMSTRQLVNWAIDRDNEYESSSESVEEISGNEGDFDENNDVDSGKSFGPHLERLREIASDSGVPYCLRCLDGWLAGTWPRAPALRILKVVGVTRRDIWIRSHHLVYKVETNRGAAYLYPPDKEGYSKIVLETEGSMSQGQLVKINQKILGYLTQFEPALTMLD